MQDVAIIGAGPSGLYCADYLARAGFSVTVVERMPSPARKFLMAGRGGLNLTHSEDLSTFLPRYREATSFLEPIVRAFPPAALRAWCEDLGQTTFVGTSGRVFPMAMKASPLLRALLQRLGTHNASLLTRCRFTGFDASGNVQIQREDGALEHIAARAVLLAMGGASWPKLGSDAGWTSVLREQNIHIAAFQPSNCGFEVAWSPYLIDRFAGAPLKRIAVSIGGKTVAGEAVISQKGLEGGAVYALSADIRNAIITSGQAELHIDLRPGISHEDLAARLSRPRGKQSLATFLKKTLKLKAEEQSLLRENGPLPATPADLAARIKCVTVNCTATYGIERAISSAGGIALEELDDTLMIRKMPGVFAAGEMLDWEAPTGGYLLQACFALAHHAAGSIENYLDKQGASPP